MFMRLVFLSLLFVLLAGCTPARKPTTQEMEKEYDYRNALQNYKIGINHISNDEIIEAIQRLESAVKLDESNFRYHHGLALAYSLNGQMEEALAHLNTVLEINPNHAESYNLLGSIYTDLGRYDEAMVALKKVIMDKSYAQPQFAYFNFGLCKRKQGRKEEAIAAFNRVTQIDPQFYRAFVALAELYKEVGDYPKALLHFQKAEPGFTDSPEILFEIGHALFKLRRFDEAKSYLAQVSILFPPPNIDKPTQDMLRYIEKYQRQIER